MNKNSDIEIQKEILQILEKPPYEYSISTIIKKLNRSPKTIHRNSIMLITAGSIVENQYGYKLKNKVGV